MQLFNAYILFGVIVVFIVGVIIFIIFCHDKLIQNKQSKREHIKTISSHFILPTVVLLFILYFIFKIVT